MRLFLALAAISYSMTVYGQPVQQTLCCKRIGPIEFAEVVDMESNKVTQRRAYALVLNSNETIAQAVHISRNFETGNIRYFNHWDDARFDAQTNKFFVKICQNNTCTEKEAQVVDSRTHEVLDLISWLKRRVQLYRDSASAPGIELLKRHYEELIQLRPRDLNLPGEIKELFNREVSKLEFDAQAIIYGRNIRVSSGAQ